MTKSLRLQRVAIGAALAVGGLLGPAVPGQGQPPATGDTDPPGFERRYLQAADLRADRILLHDWPALSALVRWSSGLEEALSESDATLSAELLEEFRAKVDSLAAGPLPRFLTGAEADTARAAMGAIGRALDRAEASLGALPPGPTPSGGEAINEADRRRTLVTGRTAVTVPAGVRVGEADTLPTAEIVNEGENFFDLVALALTELDRLVHLTRKVGTEAPRRPSPGPGPTPRAGTGPSRPGR